LEGILGAVSVADQAPRQPTQPWQGRGYEVNKLLTFAHITSRFGLR